MLLELSYWASPRTLKTFESRVTLLDQNMKTAGIIPDLAGRLRSGDRRVIAFDPSAVSLSAPLGTIDR